MPYMETHRSKCLSHAVWQKRNSQEFLTTAIPEHCTDDTTTMPNLRRLQRIASEYINDHFNKFRIDFCPQDQRHMMHCYFTCYCTIYKGKIHCKQQRHLLHNIFIRCFDLGIQLSCWIPSRFSLVKNYCQVMSPFYQKGNYCSSIPRRLVPSNF